LTFFFEGLSFRAKFSSWVKNVQRAHAILSSNLLPKSQQGLIRPNPMFVLNSDDMIEYVAVDPKIVQQELDKLFHDIDILQNSNLN
jgi:hypothetical protein